MSPKIFAERFDETAPPLAPTVPTEPIYRLSVEQYHAMIAAGIVPEGDPVELLDGWLVARYRQTSPHSDATRMVSKALEALATSGWYVEIHKAFTTDTSEPEPDILVVQSALENTTERFPAPEEVGLVVEVADLSLQRDQGLKKQIYARAHIPEYWLVNLIDKQIEVYTDPSGPADQPDYRMRQDYKPGQAVPVMIEGREVGKLAVKDLLP